MSIDNCMICASDEAICLDIEEQPSLKIKAKNCKLNKFAEDGLSTKVCYKCAFEIDLCNQFVNKIKKASKLNDIKDSSCAICSEEESNFFDLSKNEAKVDFIERVRDLFIDELKDKQIDNHLVCLTCRYCVELLNDLRNLSEEGSGKLKSVKNGTKTGDLPKTRTSIVNRKTTFIESPNLELNTPSDTDSEISEIMVSKKKVSKVSKAAEAKIQHKCGQCKTLFENGTNMYKIYNTGLTVCKNCWLTTDPSKKFKLQIQSKAKSRKKRKVIFPETPLCSILLDDVLQGIEEFGFLKETDKKGRIFYKKVGTDNDIQKHSNDDKSNIVESENAESKIEIEVEKESDNEEEEKVKPSKQNKGRSRKASEKSTKESPRASRKRKDSEVDKSEPAEVTITRSTRKRKESVTQETEIKPKRESRRRKVLEENKKQEIEQEIMVDKNTANKRNVRRRKDSEVSLPEDSEVNVEADSDNSPSTKKARKSTGEVETSETSPNFSKTKSRKRGRSSSVESSSGNRKSTRKTKKTSVDLDELVEVDEEMEPKQKDEEQVTKRPRRGKTESEAEHSDAEAEDNAESKRSNSTSSKDSIFKAPESVKSDKSKSEKSKSTESESEEIDILRATDEENKEDKNDLEQTETQDYSKSDDSKEILEETSSTNNTENNVSIEKLDDKGILESDKNELIRNKEEIENEEKSTAEGVEEMKESDNENENLKIDADIDADENEDKSSKAASSRQSSVSPSSKTQKSKLSNKKSRKNSKSVDDIIISDSEDINPDIIKEEDDDEPYACKVCDKVYDSRFIGLQHELTHKKKLEIKLQKVAVSEVEITNDSDDEERVKIPMETDNDKEEQEDKCANVQQISDDENGDIIQTIDENIDKSNNSNENLEESDVESRSCEKLRDRKSRVRRQTRMNSEEDKQDINNVESSRIAEAVQETLNDMAELHAKSQKSSNTEKDTDVDNEKENEVRLEQIENVSENEGVENIYDNNEKIQANADKPVEEIIECESIEDDVDLECEAITPVVDIEDVSQDREIIRFDDEPERGTINDEVEITEVNDTLEASEDVQQVYFTENENPVQNDDVQIDETHNKESEITIITSEEASVENKDGNPNKVQENGNSSQNGQNESNSTEDEAIDQESLEELMQRKGLQVIDELEDNSSEKDVNSDGNVTEDMFKKTRGLDGEFEITQKNNIESAENNVNNEEDQDNDAAVEAENNVQNIVIPTLY